MMLRALRGDANWSKCAKDDRRWARIGNVVNSVSSMLLIHLSSFAQRSSILSWCFYAQGTCFRVPLAFIKASTSNSAELFVLVFPRLVVVRPTIGSAWEVSWPACALRSIYTQAFLTHGTGLWLSSGKPRIPNRQRELVHCPLHPAIIVFGLMFLDFIIQLLALQAFVLGLGALSRLHLPLQYPWSFFPKLSFS